MNSFRQLARRPLKAVLGLALVTLAAAVFVTCMGQYLSVGQFRQEVEETYSTVACPTEESKKLFFETVSGIETRYGFDMNPDLWELLQDQAAQEGGLVLALSNSRLYTAYLPEVSPLNYTDHWEAAYNPAQVRGAPYSCAMLAVRLTGIDPQIEPKVGGWLEVKSGDDWIKILRQDAVILHCEGIVEQVVALQEGFADPTGRRIELDVAVWDQEELDKLGLETGGLYLVYGRDYKDLDYELRSEVSLDQLNFEQPFSMDKVSDRGSHWTDPQGNQRPLYSYENTEGDVTNEIGSKYTVFSPDKLDWVNACGLTLCDRSALPLITKAVDETGHPTGWNVDPEHRVWYHSISEALSLEARNDLIEPVDAAEYMQCYHAPTIAPLTGSVEDFLADPAHRDWAQALEDTKIDHHAFPLLAVDKVGYQGDFARQQARIVEGRDFTPREQAEGSRVCVISQSLAAANGLTIGDQITLRNYSFDPNIYENNGFDSDTLPAGAFYSHTQGFNDEGAAYTIVGLYRQDNEWHNEESAYGFLPNTVFVPSGAVSGDAYTCNNGMYLSIVLKNGSQEEFEQLLKDAGFSRCFSYYDQGYSKIAG
ncbi:MAG: ABC transporter permease, partial [Ruminiclostridium sp.]|nr:ABC transporter permease [Ruminiclostridium sp.]MBP3520174.1 ABC transporter permease [Oscillospiraceae bacterium]